MDYQATSQVIIDYINKPQTDYAIMIDGDWGTGKTHFWKKILKPKIEAAINAKPLYISLYGVTTTEEIANRIFFEMYPLLKKVDKYSESAKTFINVAGVIIGKRGLGDIKLDKQLFLKRAPLYCFDDLERAKLDIIEILGFINKYIEHDGSKVIIIANEKEILESEKLRETYTKYKEKIIGKTIKFTPKIEEAIVNIISDFTESGYAEILNTPSITSMIIQSVERSKNQNLRSVKRALSDFYTLYLLIANIDGFSIKENRLINILLEFIIVLSLEIRAGNFKQEMIEKFENTFFSPRVYSQMTEKDDDSSDNVKKYPQIIFKVYCPISNEALYFSKNIAFYIFSGIIDENQFQSECIHLLQHHISNSDSDNKLRPIHIFLNNFWDFEDDEFEQTVHSVYKDLLEGNFRLESYPLLYNRFEYFIDKGLQYLSVNKEQLTTDISSGLKLAKNRLETDSEFMGDFLKRHFNPFEDVNKNVDSLSDNGKKVLRDAENYYRELTMKQNEIVSLATLNYLPDNYIEFSSALRESGSNDIPVFAYIGANQLLSKVLGLKNGDVIKFRKDLSYRVHLDRELLQLEIQTFREFNILLNNYLSQVPTTIKTLVLKSLFEETAKIANLIVEEDSD